MAILTGPTEGLGNITVTVDASGSYDPDGDPLTFSYAQLLGPPVEITPAGDTADILLPTVSKMEKVIIEVIANDGELDSEPDVQVITINLVSVGCLCRTTPNGLCLLLCVLGLWRFRRQRFKYL